MNVPPFLVTGVIYTIAVVVLVLVFTPRPQNADGSGTKLSFTQLLKISLLSGIVCILIAYILYDSESNNIMTNMIKTDPDF